jgi:hypothetical protein
MLGENVKMSERNFIPFLPEPKEGYYDLEQIKPGVVSCPFCGKLIDIKKHKSVLSTYEAVKILAEDSWASVPICSCPGVWAVYSPMEKKWAARYQARYKGGFRNPEGD